ncbi:dihydrolipoamide acetyltransferase family protein [Amycolatopsis sp.]|uniref:dihydrolipoamide acetyltransferase family protein n=1 Tax=Amycolatopsis sp. TaxID=37632 RepID=UPI002C2408EA|nr:dihydrolipoamide acetyltransferase family protein [Amycolatopsis sp.]HVV13506.1 dihydrolipoamide acetyltransferase family protein [Amycolatopsis sp.]
MPEFKQFLLADTAEGLTEAEILGWRVQPGDTVTVNQIVVEVETAKAAVELPIPWAGKVTELLVEPGQTVEVGAPILTIDLDPAGAARNGSAPAVEEEMKPLVGYGSKTVQATRRARKQPAEKAPVAEEPVAKGGYVPLAKPPVRKLAKDLGVDLTALSAGGRVITREDVERAASPAAPKTSGERERRVPIKGVRKATAQAMVSSAFTAPHVTEFLTIDVTPMMELREKLKKHPAFAGVKLTPLAFAAKAVCLAAKRTPDVNATWDEAAGEIVYKDYVHLGIAAATPRGLVVPKIRDADAMSLAELAGALEQLTSTAREGKTTPADMLNGTITITNVGVFGVDTGTPIINPGEAAILAFGAIKDMPWVVDGELAVRKVLQLALSFDHRLVDGQQGSQFLADVGALLADPAMAITF